MTIIVESAIKLDNTQRSEIQALFSKKILNAEYEYVVNPKILGGLRITMGGKRIDLSLDGKLRQIGSIL